MALEPVGLFGDSLRQRSIGGLEANLGAYGPTRQSFHVHERPSLSILLSGIGVDRSRRQDHLQPPLTAVFHPTHEPHANDIDRGGVVGFTLSFDPHWLARHQIAERDLGSHRILPSSVWWRLRTIRLLCLAFAAGDQAAADLDSLAFEMLTPMLEASLDAKSPSPAETSPGWLDRAQEFVHTAYRTPISLRTVANEVGVHPVYFARVFRRRFGCSLGEYVRALRLADAAETILHSPRSLASAALTSGFSDQPHLCRHFAKTLRFSPNRLRTLIQQKGRQKATPLVSSTCSGI